MKTNDVVKQVAETVAKEGNSEAVFGQPIMLESKHVIPVACVRLGAGGGGVGPNLDADRYGKQPFSGGGGGGLDVRPVGFIHERGGEVVFTPIHLDVRNKPLLAEAATGLGRVIDSVASMASALMARRSTRQPEPDRGRARPSMVRERL